MTQTCPKCKKSGDFPRTTLGFFPGSPDPNFFRCSCGHNWPVEPDTCDYDETSERSWKIAMPFAIDTAGLVDLAEGLESGDIIPGSWTLNLPENHGLPPDLIKRLKPLLQKNGE